MTVFGDTDGTPPEFRRAIASLRSVTLRPEVQLDEAPAPRQLAPYSMALTADVVVADEDLATGRLVVLHDPDGPDAWAGTIRMVSLVQADIEPEAAADPLLPAVGWSWLIDALDARNATYGAASGTVTRLAEESFGLDREPTAKVEIRASWTPHDEDLGPHLSAWSDVLCQAGGLPPVPPDVAILPNRSR
ncbi:MAG: DUF3000 family protein [Streptosporangiales bacterium]|nr:DUF3000 family protein [Streptosporangiales bacterium]